MPNTVRWAVVGSGGIARRRTIPEGIIPADNAELVCVYDVDRKVNVEVAREFGAEPLGSLDEVLKADIDAVYVATPAYVHHEQVLACADAGKHVLCEKPLGMTVEQAREMLQAAQNAGVLLGTALMMRFHSQHQEALRLIREGRLGTLVYARTQLSCWYPPITGAWRQESDKGGGGALMDMGGHCIDLLEMFLGRVSRVSCFINNTVHDYQTEDSATAMLFFENGAMATVDTFFCIPDASSKNVLELYGSRGSIIAKGTIGQGTAERMTAYLEQDNSDYDAQQARRSDNGLVLEPEPVNTYRAEIEQFSRAILERKTFADSAQLGLRNQIVLAACYESARTATVIPVPAA
ncbi:MAG: Gfo/Idh/MocA family oxidoreductase [Phycisphaerales bacterium]|nr:MAG: Gfo/Idh/MocA family oxidoreductase [Phycisphaerales bacterium]